MTVCSCQLTHEPRWVVLTGGPGAGKSAILELIRQTFCPHVVTLPEAASIVFGGGFPRGGDVAHKQAAQRAIYFVQRELEATARARNPALVLCDRGVVDGVAYWEGSPDLWTSLGTTLTEQLERYDTVIHLRTPAAEDGYNYQNPLRIETPEEALRIDARIGKVWEHHPKRFVINPASDFLHKVARTMEILKNLMPECCARSRGHSS